MWIYIIQDIIPDDVTLFQTMICYTKYQSYNMMTADNATILYQFGALLESMHDFLDTLLYSCPLPFCSFFHTFQKSGMDSKSDPSI